MLQTRSIHSAILRILDQVQDLAQMFIQPDVESSTQFAETMENMEKRFVRDNEFISTSLAIIGKKGNFPWCKYNLIHIIYLSDDSLSLL